ncbi:MAG: hypothetical protein OXE84_04825 [Rhodobacteraceae bacterium]|nr:hypothetical protein [Paracoccaceae bacterium]MCY4196586.1 hypothetical protein [Paracoccaceae bacterium]MCY4326363.1 hypothetical protein [Paracoccaceae bacterium]
MIRNGIICALGLSSLVACSAGPEETGERVAEPRAIPHTQDAARHRVPVAPPPCIHNRVPRTVRLMVDRPGRMPGDGLVWPIEPGRFLPLPPSESLVISFAATRDGRIPDDPPDIRSRLYMIHVPARADNKVGCLWQLRADPAGRIDLFATDVVAER